MRTGRERLTVGGLFFFSMVVVFTSPLLAAPFAYVTDDGSGNVSVMDLATSGVAATILVGSNPRGVAVSPAGTRVYVSNSGTDNVSVIDTATKTVVTTVPIPPPQDR